MNRNFIKIPSKDGSNTAFSLEYGEHYHSTQDGALKETLGKHIIPAFLHTKAADSVNILDLCFGLGFNTLATICYFQKHSPKTKIKIFSPELDEALIESLSDFTYPDEFGKELFILHEIIKNRRYDSTDLTIELFLGDAKEYIKRFEDNFFDIIYQDAFSPEKNPALWTTQHFKELKRIIKPDGILTTYSIALKVRIALHENGFFVYLHKTQDLRSSTIASPILIENLKLVDVVHKMRCNKETKSLHD